MPTGAITEYLDVALLTFNAFLIFFFGLIFYIQRESRREGYPLEHEVTGDVLDDHVWVPEPKAFHMADGSVTYAPKYDRDGMDLNADRPRPVPGEPYEPRGNPLLAGVGPGSYTLRRDVPEFTTHGEPRVVPMRVANDFTVAEKSPDPRGMTVVGADGQAAGTIKDIWVDRSEQMIRFYEVELPGRSDGIETAVVTSDDGSAIEPTVTAIAPRTVLLPLNFCVVRSDAGQVHVHAVQSGQFAHVPATAKPDQITSLEEDKIMGYFGGGQLYATPMRAEPLL